MTASAPAPERILQRLDWTVVRRLDGLLQGDYRSLFRGNGVDFADLREYEYGDDVRHIDWNVTARMDTPYVREFLEDREITAWFLLDLSPSVDFGTVESERQKRTRPRRVRDDPGPGPDPARQPRRRDLLRQRGVERTIPARGGRVQVLRLINDLVSHPRRDSAPFTDLAPLLEAGPALDPGPVARVRRSRTSSARPGWERPLERLTERHEVIAVRLFDRRETELPDVGPMLMDDAETGRAARTSTPTTRRSGGDSRRRPSGARRTSRRRSGGPASTRSPWRPTTTCWRRSSGWPPGGGGSGTDDVVHLAALLLLLLLAIPLGVAIYRRREARRAARAAAFGWGSGRRRGAAAARSGPAGAVPARRRGRGSAGSRRPARSPA